MRVKISDGEKTRWVNVPDGIAHDMLWQHVPPGCTVLRMKGVGVKGPGIEAPPQAKPRKPRVEFRIEDLLSPALASMAEQLGGFSRTAVMAAREQEALAMRAVCDRNYRIEPSREFRDAPPLQNVDLSSIERRIMGLYDFVESAVTAQVETPQEPLTVERIREAMDSIPPRPRSPWDYFDSLYGPIRMGPEVVPDSQDARSRRPGRRTDPFVGDPNHRSGRFRR